MSADDVVPPMRITLVRRSSTLWAGAVCQTQVICGSCTGVPIQPNRMMSNFTLAPSGEISFSRCSSGMLLVGMPITVPSRLAPLYS